MTNFAYVRHLPQSQCLNFAFTRVIVLHLGVFSGQNKSFVILLGWSADDLFEHDTVIMSEVKSHSVCAEEIVINARCGHQSTLTPTIFLKVSL